MKAAMITPASLVDTYCQFVGNELWVKQMHIAEYRFGSYANHEAKRDRKLLLNRKELNKLAKQVKDTGKTTNYGVFRLNKIKLADGGALKGRIKHSWREHGDETLDKNKCQYLRGDNAEKIWENYKNNIATLTQAPRSNSVGCLEVVITCSRDSVPKDKQADFFNDSVKALKKQFGSQNLCGVALHHDETAPHLHAFVTPIQELENGTKKLNAKHWTGGKQKMVELQNFFHKEVFQKYGLARGEPAELTKRKNQRARLTQRENIVKGREEALRAEKK